MDKILETGAIFGNDRKNSQWKWDDINGKDKRDALIRRCWKWSLFFFQKANPDFGNIKWKDVITGIVASYSDI